MVTVAFDATPLIGARTGIGTAVGGWLADLASRPDLQIRAYGLTLSGWRTLPAELPAGVRRLKAPLPAVALQRVWARASVPRVEWWAGAVKVVHGTNFVVPPSSRAARLLTVWDLTALRYPELCSPAALRYPGLVRRAAARGATVHVTSRFVAEEVMEHFRLPAEQVVVIPLGVGPGPDGSGDGREGLCRPDGRRGRPPYILALGTAEPRKDLPTLVRAFDELAGDEADLELWIAGPEGWGEQALSAAVAAARHSGRIRRLGWVEDRDALLRQAAVFAFPSIYEGFGLPPLEAMLAGVPVVATAAGAVPEVVGEAALLVPVGDATALAGALRRALTDPAERRRLVTAGAARVTGYRREDATAALAELYRRLAAG